jgi:hypothetical protein
MIAFPERTHSVQWIDEATAGGARHHKACELLGISPPCRVGAKAVSWAAMRDSVRDPCTTSCGLGRRDPDASKGGLCDGQSTTSGTLAG